MLLLNKQSQGTPFAGREPERRTLYKCKQSHPSREGIGCLEQLTLFLYLQHYLFHYLIKHLLEAVPKRNPHKDSTPFLRLCKAEVSSV